MKPLFKIIPWLLLLCLIVGVYQQNPPIACVAIGAFVVAVAFTQPKTDFTIYKKEVSPDVTKIQTYIGKVKKGVWSKLVNSMAIATDTTLVPNVKNVYVTTELAIKNGPKPYTGEFKPIGNDLDYIPHQYSVDPLQRDLIVDPRKYRTSHLAYERGNGESSKNNTIPFEQFTIKTVLENDAAILNDQTAWGGLGKSAFSAYSSGSTYAAGARVFFALADQIQYFVAKASINAGESPLTTPAKWANANALAITVGLGTRIKTARDAGEITKVISASGKDSYPLFKEVFRAHTDARKALGVQIYSNSSQLEGLMDDFENKVGKYTENDGSGRMYLANTNKKAELISATWMANTNMILSTPKANLLTLTDELSDLNTVNVIPDVYNLKMGIAGVIGFGFEDAREIVITDQN